LDRGIFNPVTVSTSSPGDDPEIDAEIQALT
jgi:hypothetical protein